MKKTIIGYLPTVLIFGGALSAWLFSLLDSHGEFNIVSMCILGILIFSFVIGGILNIAFLAYSLVTGRLENVLRGSTSEGIVSKGGVMTATITFLVQFGIITILSLS